MSEIIMDVEEFLSANYYTNLAEEILKRLDKIVEVLWLIEKSLPADG